jgi:predicted outer membrane repeat protein
MLSHSALWNNSSSIRGGTYSGIGGYKQSGVLHALNSTFTHNSAVESGGAMEGQGTIELAHCTVSGNQSTGPSGTGGGIHSAGLRLRHCIIAGNSAATDPNLSNCIISGSVSNFLDGNAALVDIGNGVLIPDIDSPVIDAGLSASNIPATDQRCRPRVSGEALDIGAVEFQVRTVNTLADEDNGLAVGGISLRDAVNAQATDPVELVDFAPDIDGGTIVLDQMIGNYLQNIAIDASDLPSGIHLSGNDQSGIFRFLWCHAFVRNLALEDSNTSAVTIGDASLEMEDCVFRDNHSSTSGGALKTIGSLSTFGILKNCHFDANTSDGEGGAISNEGIIHVIDSTFTQNHAQLSGGAISSGAYRSGMRLINSTLVGNSSEMDGGAIAAASAQLIHSTITGNNAPNGSGGGIHSESTFENPELGFTYSNCIVAANHAASSPDVSGLINATYGGNLVGTDPHLAPLADYGSGIPVMPPLAGSPAIEGGGLLDSTPPLDALGHPRPSGPLPDTGAVEAFPWSQLTLLDTDHDGIDDRLEPAYQMTVGTDESARDLDGDGSTDAVELSNMTDPADPLSKFRVRSITPAPGFDPSTNPTFDITFSSFPGLTYTAECHSGLDFGSPGTRITPLGTAADFECTRRVTLENSRDFLRVRRDP